MITIRLLGGAKRALGGRSSLQFDKSIATISEVLEFLQKNSSDPKLLDGANLIVAVNGVDSAALGGQDTTARTGDVITVVTVVHGGSFTLDSGIHVAIVGVKTIRETHVGPLVDGLRNAHKGVSVQAVNASSVFGTDHVLSVLTIVLEARKRRTMVAKRVESELLLRLAFTDQISDAISRAGLRQGEPACFIAFSNKETNVRRFEESLANDFEVDSSVLDPNVQKKSLIVARLGLRAGEGRILDHLVERAAILV